MIDACVSARCSWHLWPHLRVMSQSTDQHLISQPSGLGSIHTVSMVETESCSLASVQTSSSSVPRRLVCRICSLPVCKLSAASSYMEWVLKYSDISDPDGHVYLLLCTSSLPESCVKGTNMLTTYSLMVCWVYAYERWRRRLTCFCTGWGNMRPIPLMIQSTTLSHRTPRS